MYGCKYHPYADHLRAGLRYLLSTLYVDVEVAGLSGDLVQGLMGQYLSRIKAKCPADEEWQYDWIIIMGGTNDLASISVVGCDEATDRSVASSQGHDQHPMYAQSRSPASADMMKEDILNSLWPSIQKLNAESQGHARLPRSILMTMPKETPVLPKSSKGTTMRGEAERSLPEISTDYLVEDHIFQRKCLKIGMDIVRTQSLQTRTTPC